MTNQAGNSGDLVVLKVFSDKNRDCTSRHSFLTGLAAHDLATQISLEDKDSIVTIGPNDTRHISHISGADDWYRSGEKLSPNQSASNRLWPLFELTDDSRYADMTPGNTVTVRCSKTRAIRSAMVVENYSDPGFDKTDANNVLRVDTEKELAACKAYSAQFGYYEVTHAQSAETAPPNRVYALREVYTVKDGYMKQGLSESFGGAWINIGQDDVLKLKYPQLEASLG